MLVKKLNAQELKEEFKSYDRDYYSLEACQAMIDMFEEYEADIELDIIALCGEFTEDCLEDILENYGLESREELEDNTIVRDTLHETVLIQDY